MLRTIFLLLLGAAALFAQRQPFTAETMMKLARISEPVLSPNGREVAFTVQTINLEANTKPTQVYTVPIAGGRPQQLTVGMVKSFNGNGTRVLFTLPTGDDDVIVEPRYSTATVETQ